MNLVLLILIIAVASTAVYWAKKQQAKTRKLTSELTAEREQVLQLKKDAELNNLREKTLFSESSEAFFVFDQSDGSLLEVNHEAERLTGYSQGEVTHISFKILFSREHRQRLLRVINKASKTGQAKADGIKFRRKNGRHFVGEINIKTGKIEDRDIIHGSFRDTTKTTNLQLELHRNNHHLTLLNQISHRVAEGHDLAGTLEIILDEVIGSFAISGGGIFLLENQATEMKLALHRNIPDDVVNELGRIQPGIGLAGKVIESGRPRMSTNLQKDHRRISQAVAKDNWKAFLAVPFIAEEKTLGVLFVFDRGHTIFKREDVRLMQAIGRQLGPTLKNAELFDELQWQHRLNFASMRELERSRSALRKNLEQLEISHRALQNLNQMKSVFLSLASHELRTPLTTILSGAEFLQEQTGDDLQENEKRALEVIIRGSERLNHIVDDLLEAAKLEAKALYMAREAFNPLPMIKELLSEASLLCNERQLQLRLLQFPENAVIRGDALYLKRAYSRLLENAVKFTPENGQIEIDGKIVDREEVLALNDKLKKFSDSFFDGPFADKYLEIAISDNGIGIDEHDQLLIFDKFHEIGDISSHSSSRVNFGGKGVGLGLTLVKGIIESHNGLVWVESAGPGKGSCLSTLLPLSSPAEGKHVLG